MRRFLYDTAVFVYALGGDHRYREPCRSIVARAAASDYVGEASADLLQELVHQRLRRTGDRAAAARAGRDVAALCRLHRVEPADALRGVDLFEAHGRLSARDAVFAAVALNRGISVVLTPDRGFDGIGGLERVDPADPAAVLALFVA